MVYYIMYRGQVTGPMNKEQIFSYPVDRETMISADGGEWRPLYTYPDLMTMLSNNRAAGCGQQQSYQGYQRQMSFGEAISTGFSKFATFTGRGSRSEFWWWQLFCFILSSAVSTVGYMFTDTTEFIYNPFAVYTSPAYLASGVLSLVLFLPNLGMSIRRLHDTGRSGWWVLLNFLCCIGSIILLVWYCQPSQEGENEYGPMPNVE